MVRVSSMHREAFWVDAEVSVVEVAKAMKEQDAGAMPVGSDGRLIGMITHRDLVYRVLAENRDPLKIRAREVMSSGLVYCPARPDR